MKIKTGVFLMIWIFVSNSAFCQDTSHTKLVDKYYPESKTETPPAPINKEITPVTRTSSSRISVPKTPVSQVPLPAPVSKTSAAPVTDSQTPLVSQAPVSKVPVSQNPIYNDTRLGSSSPAYQTYKDNNNGAGSITTNPNKGVGDSPYNPGVAVDSSSVNPIYRDTRLGSSSPLYNTYEKNNNGAGAVTTNPNKQ